MNLMDDSTQKDHQISYKNSLLLIINFDYSKVHVSSFIQ
jgi:hypothetical protein